MTRRQHETTEAYHERLAAEAAQPAETPAEGLREASKPVQWPNACAITVPRALRFLAENPRPSGGEQTFNSAHLYQLADEIERMASAPLYAAPAPLSGRVGSLRETADVLVDRLGIDEMVQQWCDGDRNAPEFVPGLVRVLRKRLSRATLAAAPDTTAAGIYHRVAKDAAE